MLPELSDDRLVELFREMWLVRRWEERLIRLAAEGESFGHFHVYVGQEAIGIPALAALTAVLVALVAWETVAEGADGAGEGATTP